MIWPISLLKKKRQDIAQPPKVTGIPKLNGGVALDLGANIGSVTQKILDAGATKVYAVEPNPFAFNKLKERFRDDARVICINKAIYHQEAVLPLFFHENSDQDELTWSVGSSLLSFKKNILPEKYHEVEAIDVVNFIKGIGGRIVFVKMDIEGVECLILNRLIDSGIIEDIDALFVETHDHKIPELKVETDIIRHRIKALGLESKINLNWI